MTNPFSSVWKWLSTPIGKPKTQASTTGYDAGAQGRRALGWSTTRQGPNTILVANLGNLRSRSRDAVRNSAIARSAIDKFESNVIGTGIVPHFQHPDEAIRTAIQTAWDKWVKVSDYHGQLSFYGQQALLVREIFESGECLVRFHVQDERNPLTLQLIESEQLPEFRTVYAGIQDGATEKAGIVFDEQDRKVGYRIYQGNPYDSQFDTIRSTQFVFVPASDMLHVFKPLRAGQLRGEPHMVSVLSLLHELEQYADAERVRKKVAAMFAVFITKNSLEDQVLPPTPQPSPTNPVDPSVFNADAGTDTGKIEPGTIQFLLPGEDIKFPTLPESGDYSAFMKNELHKFAAGVGLTYEQLTGDLEKVSYSSIRAGMLEFRRACEQYQFNIIIHGFCDPVMKRWMKESVLTGALQLPDDYFDDPTPYENCIFVPPSWDWVDPTKEISAYQLAVRCGFTSRTQVVRSQGFDPEVIDNQQAIERKRASDLGLTYDSDPNKVLIGKETQPALPSNANPDSDSEKDSEQDDNS